MGFEDEGARYIAENLKSLISLNISWNEIGSEGALHIAENLKSLTALNIASNRIGDVGTRLIIQLSTSMWLTIWENEIGAEVKQELRKQLPLCKVQF